MYIELPGDKKAIVDKRDAGLVQGFSWSLAKRRHQLYAKAYVGGGKKNPMYSYLHHRIVGKPKKGYVVDHINGDGLDNRRRNLRIIKNRLNTLSTIRRTDNTSGYKGVTWNKQCGKWQAKIKVLEERKHLGLYETKEEAAAAYRKAAKKYFGIYSKL